MQYNDTDSIQRSTEVYSSQLDEYLVLIDEDNGSYFGLHDTAHYIWEALNEPKTFKELVDLLTAKFNISRKTCITDISPFLKNLSSNDLVTIDIGNV